MSMTRQKIEDSIKEARRFIVTAQAALERLNAEKEGRNAWYEERYGAGISEPTPSPDRSPDDHSWGSPETGALRRHSLDLTRILANLRKP